MTRSVVIYAPNVHTGGGYVLLKALLHSFDSPLPLILFLDDRVELDYPLPRLSTHFRVKPTLFGRISAGIKLKTICSEDDLILCFNGLPPALPASGRIVVFLQNRLYLSSVLPKSLSIKTAIRLRYERFMSRALQYKVSEYIVQTPTMARELIARYRTSCSVRILPFAESDIASNFNSVKAPSWDFIYVADGVAHKNHLLLLEAWRILANEGIRPSLALTLGTRDRDLINHIKIIQDSNNLHVANLGHLDHNKLMCMYRECRALIFPSTSESFGLPLIEATACNLPIIAGELDFVRDVCRPVQTFDPLSAVSIARAVKRFLEIDDLPLTPSSPSFFWKQLLSCGEKY